MTRPLPTGKPTVNLAPDSPRVSRIRRDPPPAARKTVVPDRDETDRRSVAIGILVFTLAIVVIVLALGSWAGWSPSDYTVTIRIY